MEENNIQYLLEQYFNGAASEKEEAELMKIIVGMDDEHTISSEMKSIWDKTDGKLSLISEGRSEEIVNNIIKTQNTETAKIRTMHWRRIAASVISLLIIGTAASYLIFNKSEKATTQNPIAIKQQKVVLPGSNKAILTLSDGSEIVLDSTPTGILTHQGDTKISKLDNGQLAYNASDNKSDRILYNTVSTPRGGQYEIVLPDGSKVWLNAVSSLRFPTTFSGNERRVQLTGEGYFEVAKNKEKPFNVEIISGPGRKSEVEVLGTHFNIMAYNDENSAVTTLLEGSVKIKKGEEMSLLKPGDQAKVNEDKSSISILNNVNVNQAIAWKTGFFEFDDLTVPAIMRQISRWYDVDLIYDSSVTLRDKFGGRISKDISIDELLSVLEINKIKFKLAGRKLIEQPVSK